MNITTTKQISRYKSTSPPAMGFQAESIPIQGGVSKPPSAPRACPRLCRTALFRGAPTAPGVHPAPLTTAKQRRGGPSRPPLPLLAPCHLLSPGSREDAAPGPAASARHQGLQVDPTRGQEAAQSVLAPAQPDPGRVPQGALRLPGEGRQQYAQLPLRPRHPPQGGPPPPA